MISNISNTHINNNRNNKKQSFKGITSTALSVLRGLNNKPALGACAVDICSMVTPRTIIETKNRGPQSGIETLFREGLSCLHHACLGLIGFMAAALVSGGINKTFGIKAQNVIAGSDTINNLSTVWQKSEGQTDKFFEGFLNNLKGLNGTEWKGISDKAKPEIVNNLIKLSQATEKLNSTRQTNGKAAIKKEIKNLKLLITESIIKDTGAEVSYKLSGIKDTAGKVVNKGISSSLSELIDNASSLANTFKTSSLEELPKLTNALKKNKNISTVLGVAMCALIGVSIQPVNRYLTKKRTGQDGFVGVKNKESEKSKGFKVLKTLLGAAFPVFAVNLIGKPSELISNLQFNSKIPSLNHFKFIYSLTICSRLMSARDKNELRESFIKDSLGYTNWLILGGMVSKLTARALGGKELINNPIVNTEGKKGVKYAAKWLTKTSVKSIDEILLPKSKELVKNGKALKFSELFKKADTATKSKILKVGFSQFAGYLYSGLVLGIGIAKLNIFITKQVEARKNAKNKLNNNTINTNNNNLNTYYISDNQKESVFKDFT